MSTYNHSTATRLNYISLWYMWLPTSASFSSPSLAARQSGVSPSPFLKLMSALKVDTKAYSRGSCGRPVGREGGREGGRGGKGGRERYIVIINFIFSLTSCRGPWLTSPDSQVDEVVSIAIPLSVHFERIDLEIATLI